MGGNPRKCTSCHKTSKILSANLLFKMAEDLKRYFLNLMKMVDGLHAIIITDREGVPVLKVCDEDVPEMATRPKFLATSGMVMDQANKLGLLQNKSFIAMFGNHQVVCISKLPLIITMIASSTANTGMILSLEDEMAGVLQDIISSGCVIVDLISPSRY